MKGRNVTGSKICKIANAALLFELTLMATLYGGLAFLKLSNGLLG